MALLWTISVLLPLALGFGIVAVLWPPDLKLATLLRLSISLGIGCGACSGLLLAWLVVVGRPGRGIILVEIAALLLLVWYPWRKRCRETTEDGRPWHPRLLLCSAGVVLSIAAAIMVLRVVNTPHGDWDGWASWNVKARMIYLGGEQWRDVFSHLLVEAHPDYPLFLPLSVVGLWLALGSASPFAPALLAVGFTCSTVLLLGSGLSVLRDRSQALLAATILAATPFFVIHGTSQYADVEVAFFFLATFVLLALYAHGSDPRLMALAGMTAGLSAWTKNEGFVYLLAVTVSFLVFSRRRRDLLWFALGAAAPLAMFLYVKGFHAAPDLSVMLAGQQINSTPQKLIDFPRYRMTAAAFLSEILHLGNWPISVSLLLAVHALVSSVRSRVEIGRLRPFVSVLILMLGVYVMIFIVSPFDPEFYLSSSLNRLFLQLWPSALFVYFMVVRTPAEAMTSPARVPWRTRLASLWLVVVLCVSLWAAAAALLARWRGQGRLAEQKMTDYERRLSTIKALLPGHGVIGYSAEAGWSERELFWTRHFLAPMIVVNSPGPDLVVLNRPSSAPASVPIDGSYRVEEHDGMKLYDFGTGIYLEDRRGMHSRESPQS
jgi:hypothetical protein